MQSDNNKIKIRRVVFFFHIIFWLVLFSLTFNYTLEEVDIIESVLVSLYTILVSSIPFYLNYFYFSKYLFEKQNFFVYFLQVALVLAVPLAIVNFTEYSEWLIEEGSYSQSLDLILNLTFLIMISNLIKGTEVWLSNRQREAQIEKEKIQVELNFLKAQINPHFLFNSLNNIYSLAYSGNKKAPEMISKLSKILRYMIYDCKENRMPIVKEIEAINNLIDLQLLKIGNDRHIDIYTEGIERGMLISPSLMITLVENSFKHGDLDVNEKGWINISCIVEDKNFLFEVSNSYNQKNDSKDEMQGIGLENVRRQLKINYPDKHEFFVEQNETEFKVVLKIELD